MKTHVTTGRLLSYGVDVPPGTPLSLGDVPYGLWKLGCDSGAIVAVAGEPSSEAPAPSPEPGGGPPPAQGEGESCETFAARLSAWMREHGGARPWTPIDMVTRMEASTRLALRAGAAFDERQAVAEKARQASAARPQPPRRAVVPGREWVRA